jgi:hypothetical protein
MSDADPEVFKLHPPFLRRVTFVDLTPFNPGDRPVSVPNRVLLDGVDHSEILPLGAEWEIVGRPEVLVSFVAFAEHVTTMSYESRGSSKRTHLSGTHIAGIPVLTPADHDWEILPPDDKGRKFVRVWFFAQQVEVLAVNQLPEPVLESANCPAAN